MLDCQQMGTSVRLKTNENPTRKQARLRVRRFRNVTIRASPFLPISGQCLLIPSGNSPAMLEIDRRSLLYAFGIASLTPLLSGQTTTRRVAVAKPGERRYKFTHPHLNPLCMITGQDSAGPISMFEFIMPPRQGPPRHIHHCEDETYYILTGEFLFEVGGTKCSLLPGSTIYAPRDVPHCWANTAAAESRMIMACTPGGFEGFFEEASKAMMDKASPEQMNKIMAKYGAEAVGPPLFP